MARRDALLRLNKTLLARRADLCKKLARELADLRNFNAADSSGDSADLAFDAGHDEMSSRLAELDARELSQIERALARLKQGTYGLCEKCLKKILVVRLNALPYTTFCISCEREMEKGTNGRDQRGTSNWGRVIDSQAPMQDQRINLSALEMDQSDNR